jgi:hypothetical protein
MGCVPRPPIPKVKFSKFLGDVKPSVVREQLARVSKDVLCGLADVPFNKVTGQRDVACQRRVQDGAMLRLLVSRPRAVERRDAASAARDRTDARISRKIGDKKRQPVHMKFRCRKSIQDKAYFLPAGL